MVQAAGAELRVRRFRPFAMKRRIVELTFEPGASVALVARAHGVNANQVFVWRRALKSSELAEPISASTALLPVCQGRQPTEKGAIGLILLTRRTIGAVGLEG